MTESSPVISVNTLKQNKIGTVGRALKNIEVKITNEGEIIAKGPSIMKGYFKDETATNEVLKNGWLYTGDLGSIDENGHIKIIGRKKEIIVTSAGKNIAPAMIDNVLEADPFINQSFICGDGEKYIAALIVPDFDQLKHYTEQEGISQISVDELVKDQRIISFFKKRIDTANKNFADYERIKKFALLPNEFTIENGELTPTMKIKRNVILVKYKSYINALYRRG